MPKSHSFASSGAISAISYDEHARRLVVAFHNGRSYTFEDVPEDVYAEFVDAPSAGSFYNQRIKGQYA